MRPHDRVYLRNIKHDLKVSTNGLLRSVCGGTFSCFQYETLAFKCKFIAAIYLTIFNRFPICNVAPWVLFDIPPTMWRGNILACSLWELYQVLESNLLFCLLDFFQRSNHPQVFPKGNKLPLTRAYCDVVASYCT